MPTRMSLRWLSALVFLVPFALGAAGCSCEGGMPSRRDMGMGGDDGGPLDGSVLDMMVVDHCDPNPCGTNQRCVNTASSFRCVADCSAVTCDPGYSCRDISAEPTCVLDCVGFPCPSGQTCSAASGSPTCVTGCTDTCGAGQRCATVNNAFECVNNSCAELGCTATEVCEPAVGGGNVCRDNSCTTDLQCAPNENCTGNICVSDACVPGARSCSGTDVLECLGNGSGTFVRHACSQACSEASGQASCPCADDWDCPANTECVVDRCVGTGVAPTCFLPPQPFTSVLPTNEITWGGTQANRNAVGSPFPASAQAVVPPLVINLDDDNGDGLVNELDFPEIVFTTFCDNISGSDRYNKHGVLRAIHGGGPNKGRDFFASCGNAHWFEGQSTTAFDAACSCTAGILDPTATLAAGDADNDGVPEIFAVHEDNGVVIYDNEGVLESSLVNGLDGGNPAIALANVDGAGFAEVIIGRRVFTLEHSMTGALQVRDIFGGSGTGGTGTNSQGAISCAADILGDGRLEIIGGSTAYGFPNPPAGVTRRSQCTGMETVPEEVEYCAGRLLTLWDARTINGAALREGFCAVADVLGANQMAAPGPGNPLDGVPEVISISGGRLQVFNGQTGAMYVDQAIAGTTSGGPPNVDDFDGDGFPEIGTAGSTAYVMIDLQTPSAACAAWPNVMVDGSPLPAGNPVRTPNTVPCSVDSDCGFPGQAVCNARAGTCTCLHNGWMRRTEDDSSQVTGSTLFDFNGDGAAEVVYNDECFFRVYDGRDGTVYFKEQSESRTRTEYPVVADVDNDGNAEILFATSNESGFCSITANRPNFNNGIEVWGDAGDFWVSARRVWNQHAYHVTNVYEGGGIPMSEPPSWEPLNGRLYNSYRSNPQSPFGIAPDLQITGLQVSSPDAACGTFSSVVDLSAAIANAGDLRVGPGIEVSFFGTWNGVESQLMTNSGPLTVPLTTSLEAGGQLFLVARYDSAGRTPAGLPDSIRASIDVANIERECREGNNDAVAMLTTGATQADLRIQLLSAAGTCPTQTIMFTLFNDGSAPVVNPVVRFFAGDPNAGGTPIGTTTVSGTVPAGGQLPAQHTLDVPATRFQLFGVVDPDNAVPECNDGNNRASLANLIDCGGFG
ncbi:MAG: hypothetical protein KC593_17285 [Myxococcales bacterium]|nr:hypothetical protein [Myxococcales bacterium]MCB9626042.1 hypothetical protein [Sandaracinaceae bacterium]